MRALMMAVLITGVLGCGGEGAPAPASVDVARSSKARATALTVPPGDRTALAQGNAAFAFDLYRRARPADDNFVCSPLSLSTALAMTYAGARGVTELEMARTLRFAPQAQLHPAMNELDAALRARGAGARGADGGPMRLSLVNTLWAQKGFVMLPAFLDALAEHYGAGVNLVDFTGATEAARQTINAWVAGQTEKRIQELLQPGVVDPETRLVLTNAIYFNAAWKTPFPETTQNAPFHRLDGSSVDVPTMRLTAQLPVAFGDGFGAVELPYDDDRLALLVVVPDAGRFSEIDGAFDGRRLEELVGTLQPRMAGVALPRWKSETPLRLDRVLADMGMPSAFGGGADLSGIDGHPDLFIQAVVHKAFIAVGEKGTEAAAASAVVVGRKAADPPPEVLVAADRPFLYVLRDRPTGAVLFLGRVLDPGRGPQ